MISTTAVVEKIEELLAKATPGPWSVETERKILELDHVDMRIMCASDKIFHGEFGRQVASVILHQDDAKDITDKGKIIGQDIYSIDETIANAELIETLRNSIQGLLEERKRHIEALEYIRQPYPYQHKKTIDTICREALSPAGENGGKDAI